MQSLNISIAKIVSNFCVKWNFYCLKESEEALVSIKCQWFKYNFAKQKQRINIKYVPTVEQTTINDIMENT